jgi:O-antigen ligase
MGTVLRRARSWQGRRVIPLILVLTGAAWGLLLAQLPVVSAVFWTGLGLLALGTLAEPLVGLVGGLFLGLLRAYLQAEVPAVPAQVGHVFVALAAAAWIGRGLAQRQLRIPMPTREQSVPLLMPLLLFIGAGWLSLWDAQGLASYGFPELIKWLEVLLVFTIVLDRGQPRHVPWLTWGVLLTGCFQAAVGLYQFGLRGEGPDHFLIPGTDFYRAYGTFEQPNPYGGTIGMILALTVGALVGQLSGGETRARRVILSRRSMVLALVVLLLAAALGATWSRGAWIGFAAALVMMVIAIPRRTRWGLLLVGLMAALVGATAVAGLLPSSVVDRLTDFTAGLRLEDVRGVAINDANYAVIERLAHWQAALTMWRAHLWTGVGLGCYEPAYSNVALINWPAALGHAHNIYLNLLAETGLVGTAAYLLLWGAVFVWTWRATRRTVGLMRGIAVGLLGLWTHLAVHHLFDQLYVNNVHLMIGLCLGILSIIVARCGRPGVDCDVI